MGIRISGHCDEWVALVGDKIVDWHTSFKTLVKKLERNNLLNKVTLTHVNGNSVILKRKC